jgi:hypothetical protein
MSSLQDARQQFSLFENESSEQEGIAEATTPNSGFSNFIVYVDESGDHGMQTIDSNYPMFVLAFCAFYKRHYSEKVVPALQKFKFNHFGHDLILLHEHEIRKERGNFRFQSRQHKQRFMEELTDIIDIGNFVLISCVINKEKLRREGDVPPNPYNLALGFCLEALYELLLEKKQDDKLTHVVVECRGKREDADLELAFRRVCGGANRMAKPLPFNIVFADKRANSAGLQLADLVARPVGLSVLRPDQENRAFDVLKRKFFCRGGRNKVGEGFEDWGLKIYPPPESEKPR